MNRRIAIATLALMATTMSVAYAGDFEEATKGLYGSYSEPTGGKAQIKTGDAGIRFVQLNGDTTGDWHCNIARDGKDLGFEFTQGPHKGEFYIIVRDGTGKVKELRLRGGRKTVWTRN